MESLKNNVYQGFTKVAAHFVAQPKESIFLEKGQLTAQEFLEAGDTLVQKCPTWEWASTDDPKKMRKELPPEKQFLITRKVPC